MVGEKDVRRVAAESGLDVRTVRRCLVDGDRPRSVATQQAIYQACIKLGVRATMPGYSAPVGRDPRRRPHKKRV
jgi:hypothetical protein